MVRGCIRPEASAALAGSAGLPALPPLLNRRDELALAHLRGTGDALRLGDPLQFGQQHRREPGALAASALAGTCPSPAGLSGRVASIRPGAYRAVWLVGSPGRRRHAGRLIALL